MFNAKHIIKQNTKGYKKNACHTFPLYGKNACHIIPLYEHKIYQVIFIRFFALLILMQLSDRLFFYSLELYITDFFVNP